MFFLTQLQRCSMHLRTRFRRTTMTSEQVSAISSEVRVNVANRDGAFADG